MPHSHEVVVPGTLKRKYSVNYSIVEKLINHHEINLTIKCELVNLSRILNIADLGRDHEEPEEPV